MKIILFKYLTIQFLSRVFFVALALAGILIVFDLLTNIVEVTSHNDKLAVTVLHYIALRFPAILMLTLPLAVLLATIITMVRLVGNQEMIAFSSVGITIYYMTIVLSLAAIVPALFNFWLSNAIVPDTTFRLQTWAKDNYSGTPPESSGSLAGAWAVSGKDFIQTDTESENGQNFKNMTIIRRNKDSLITNFYKADSGYYDGTVLHLKNITITSVRSDGSYGTENLSNVDINISMSGISGQAQSIGEISFKTLWQATHGVKSKIQTNALYHLWLQRKITEPLGCFIMVLLAMPLGFQIQRHNSMLGACFRVMAAGFSYFIAERLLLSLGETGVLPLFLSVWSPVLIFGIMGWWFLLFKTERKG